MIIYIVFDTTSGKPLGEFCSLDHVTAFLKTLGTVNVRIDQVEVM